MAGDISRLTWTVRALALACALTLVVAGVEGSALRRQRGEVQRLIDERARVVSGQHEVWARVAAPEFARAIAAGGTNALEPQDHGFMYGWSFYDLDGNHWEVFWMDPAAIAG